LEICANLLGISPQKLGSGLTNQVTVTRGEKIVKPLTPSAVFFLFLFLHFYFILFYFHFSFLLSFLSWIPT